MERITLLHLSGPKANQDDRFPLNDFKEITIGRDPSSTVRFGEEPGTVVSRQHARITRNIAFPSQFFITDLDSRNGTYVNGQRVVGTVNLRPGDMVQCGFGGPQFQFVIEPDTEQMVIPQALAPTADLIEPARPGVPLAASSGAPIGPVVEPVFGPPIKTSVERLNAPAKKPSSRRLMVSGGVLVGVVALAAGVLFYRGIGSRRSEETANLVATPEASPAAEAAKVVEATPSPEATPANVKPAPEIAPAPKPQSKVASGAARNAGAPGIRTTTPVRRIITRPNTSNIARPNAGRIINVTGDKNAVTNAGAGKVTKKGKETINHGADAEASAKKAKKAKKEKKQKIKY